MNRIPDSWPAHGEAEVAAPPVVLAHEAPFALPPLHVEPALRRVVRDDGADTIVEPLVMQVLVALARAHGDILTRDELVDRCWGGRIVGDDSIARVIALLRKLGAEFGQGAFTIETITKVGYRLISVKPAARVQEAKSARPLRRIGGRMAALAGAVGFDTLPNSTLQPSIAVLPLRLIGPAKKHALVAEALPHDLIAQLSRLRWLFVIARASSFQFRDPEPDIRQVGTSLGVKYCLAGALEEEGGRIAVIVELVDTQSLQVIWGNRYSAAVKDIHELRANIVVGIIAALEFQIPVHEAHRAALGSPENLDAWSLYHLALQRVFRSTPEDNAAACALFEQAAALEPGFARAHAGLSFTHFQNAFMRYVADTDSEALSARRYAERAIELDAADPFANLVFGRSFWLTGELAQSLPWIDRALMLNPNYAQGAYAHAFTDAILCDGAQGQRHADHAMALSPIDPMQYAMMGARALSHAVRGEHEEAADWSDRAARAPNSHILIALIAVLCHALADREPQARTWTDAVRKGNGTICRDDFFRAFPFAKSNVEATFSKALSRFGF